MLQNQVSVMVSLMALCECMALTTEGFLEVAITRWPEWALNP